MSRRRLRVALDVSQIDNQNLGSGQFRYAVDLVNGIAALDAGVELTVIGSAARPASEIGAAVRAFPDRCRHAELAPHKGRAFYYRDVARLSWWLARHRFDVFHQIHTTIPLVKPCPVVVTAHHYYHDAALVTTRPYRYYRWAVRNRADLVITVSDATRDDFHREFNVPFARMRTVYHGLSKTMVAAEPPPAGPPYLLSPYNLTVPKNLRSLILAWPAIAGRHPSLELILYGRPFLWPGQEDAFEQLLQGVAHADRIRRVGHVTDEVLAGLYERCQLFVFPTIVEGFGYPLLEAMAHGACCLTRNASAMKEVGGDAVRLVETLRPDEISGAALALLDDPILRADLSRRARLRAASFTVEAMARKTVDCYRAVARVPA